MELMQLEMFVGVVEERSVLKAALRVCRSQPAVSIALGKLERDLGTAVFDRTRRKDYRLTQAGALLYEYASQMIGLRDEALSMLKGAATGCTGRLSIGVHGATSMRWLSRVTAAFLAKNPNVRMEISRDLPDELFRAMTERSIDLALLSAYPTNLQAETNVVLTRIAGLTKKESLWLLQHRIGRSHAVKMLEPMISPFLAIAPQNNFAARNKEHRPRARVSRAERIYPKTNISRVYQNAGD